MNTTNSGSGTIIFSNFDKMTQAMEGENTTNGWDVVCSYDLEKLNEMLSEKYKQGTLVASIPNLQIWDWVLDFNGLNVDTYDFELSAPILNFNLDGRATLTMPISKATSTTQGFVLVKGDAVKDPSKYQTQTWYSSDDKTYNKISDQSKPKKGDCAIDENTWYTIQTIPPPKSESDTTGKYSLIGSIPISAILGDKQIYNKGTVVVFKDNSPKDDAHIVLHFSNNAADPATFSISPQLDKDPNKEAKLLDTIRNYFSNSVNDIDYVLNTISPQPAPDGKTVITPKSFVFATVTTGDKKGVLSTYIQTTQNKGQGQTDPIFTVQNKSSSPIPQGNTASIIFSQDFIQNILIKNPLEKSLKNCSVKFKSQDSGIQANIYSSDVEVDIEISKIQTGSSPSPNGDPSSWTDYYVKVDGDVLSSQDYPITMQLSGNTAALAWNINKAGFNYETGSQVIMPGYSSTIPWSTDTGHKITIGISSNPSKPSTLSIDSKDNITITPTLQFDKDTYTASVTPKPNESCWDKIWNGDAASIINNDLQSALANFAPKISFQIPGLNYFATTNILFPGTNVFVVDTTTGVQVPRDLMLLGNIN